MAKCSNRSCHQAKTTAEDEAAYRAAAQEIELLRPGEAILYHQGNLVTDAAGDPALAARAAAFRHATALAKGTLAQRRLGFEWYQYIFRRGHDGRR